MVTAGGLKRTHYCTELNRKNIGETVVVAGFAHKVRDKGGLVFIDLRDRTGLLQLVADGDSPGELLKTASGVHMEYVLMAKGTVRERSSVNPDIPTGEIEIYMDELHVLSRAQTPPFEISAGANVKEELRLRHRYLDLRRPEMQEALIMRHRIVKAARDYYDKNGFIEIETPMLIKSTPEGARDYLVPSRVKQGSFYALPQSPQLYKQLLMLSGFDRYMQITRCFRDEDLRADRQPEFTQIDLEMSFVDEEDVIAVNEGFIKYVFREALNIDIALPLPRLPYKEAMERYGSDKPDTRFGLELCDLTGALRGCGFKVFSSVIENGGSVRAINVKGAASVLTRKEIDKLTELAKTYKAGGLAFTRLTAEGESSSYEKFLTEDEKNAVREAVKAETGDVILIVADSNNDTVFAALGALRLELAGRLGLIPENSFNLLWVTEFPLFEYDSEEGRFMAKHHPFTSPRLEDMDKLESDPANVRARAYDIILNGNEIGGGSIRISDPETQSRMFTALGINDETAKERFGFLLDALSYGAPPHGGLAYGLDRLVMLMLGKTSIREVIAFPKVQNASDLMSGCPSPVEDKNLAELSIAVISGSSFSS